MISAGERPQTYALDSAATGTGYHQLMHKRIALKGNNFIGAIPMRFH
jgi:hypothetical protein